MEGKGKEGRKEWELSEEAKERKRRESPEFKHAVKVGFFPVFRMIYII